MSFLSKAISSIMGKTGPSDDIPSDLRHLDKVEPGLAMKAFDYISGTGDGTVLSTLEIKGGDLLAGVHANVRGNPGVLKRRALFMDPEAQPDTIIRYVEVLTASRKGDRSRLRVLPASDATPLAVMVLMNEIELCRAQSNTGREKRPPIRLSSDRILDLVSGLGGTVEDLFDIVFFNDTNYYSGQGILLNGLLDLPGLVRAHPDAFAAQNDRLPLQGRARLLSFIAEHGLGAEPPFDQMVIAALADSSKTIREAALPAFAKLHPLKRKALAGEHLATGNAHMRDSAIQSLIQIGGDDVRETLKSHLEREKTSRIRAQITAFLEATDIQENAPHAGEDADSGQGPGYVAIDGSFVEISPMREPLDDSPPVYDDALKTRLLALGEREEQAYQKDLKLERAPYYLKYASSMPPNDFQDYALQFLQVKGYYHKDTPNEFRRRLNKQSVMEEIKSILNAFPDKHCLEFAFSQLGTRPLERYGYGFEKLPRQLLMDYIRSEDGDIRYVDRVAVQRGLHRAARGPKGNLPVVMRPGDMLIALYLRPNYYNGETDLPKENVWELVAENLSLVDRKLGMIADPNYPEDEFGALKLLDTLPKLPARYAPFLVTLALSGKRDIRKFAAKILVRNKGYEGQLVTLIDDNRQDVRAGAAKWLGEIAHKDAVPVLQKRLKKERSVVAKAAILAALEALGEDISAHIGPDALLKEAEAGLKKASFKAVDWLDLGQLPRVQYRDETAVPDAVLQWWVALSVKLKAPGDTALFELYLDQLKPEDAEKLSTWIFDSWYGYDTAPPSEAQIEADAKQQFQMIARHWNSYYPESRDLSDAEKLDLLRRRSGLQTPNSGAASKGILALAVRVPPAHGVGKVRSYLRKHGGRTSQTTALLELMAAKGDAMSLQVVIAAATRLRQKGVQAKANEMVQAVADRNEWTLDQLTDRTVPTGGLEDDGSMELPCSGGEKIYTARLDEKLALTLFNPDGKPVKSLPSGTDDETKAAKKALSAAKKEIKQAVAFQSSRLFEAMCCDRRWSVEDWQRDFHAHPLMRKLIERLIWQGLDDAGTPVATFRPSAEGEFINAEDGDVELSAFASVSLAHASTLSKEDAAAWRQHMSDYEVKPLFDQVRKDLPRLSEDKKGTTHINDRLGWVYDAFTLRGEASRAGYERGEALDGGGFDCYTRHFAGVGIVAVLEFSGNHVEQENIPVAIKSLFFERLGAGASRGYGAQQKMKLEDVPPVLLAECWADLYKISKKASFDPDWEKVCPW